MEVTNDEKLLRALVMMTTLRDDLEVMPTQKRLKQITNMWLNEANKTLDQVADGGEGVWNEWSDILLKFHNLVTEKQP